jgi:hypothetical protein
MPFAVRQFLFSAMEQMLTNASLLARFTKYLESRQVWSH